MPQLIHIDAGLCLREGACIDTCPWLLLTKGEDGYPVELSGAYDTCNRCGQCVAVCQPGALRNDLLSVEEFLGIDELKGRTDPVEFALRTRRSVRAFQPDPLPRTELKGLLDAVRYAPSSNNSQNLWWIVTTGPEHTGPLSALARHWVYRTHLAGVPEAEWPEADPALRGAPHLVVCCGPAKSPTVRVDAAIATAQLDLLASARGYGTCWAGVFLRAVADSPELADALAIPDGQAALCALMLGRPRHGFFFVPPRKPSAIDWR